jgi:hypothetical protein
MLRFKIATSLIIAILGAIMFVRLLDLGLALAPSILPLIVSAVFVVAGIWRAGIYLRALRGLAGS